MAKAIKEELVQVVTLMKRNRIYIPSRVVKKLKLKAGDRLAVYLKGKNIVIRKV